MKNNFMSMYLMLKALYTKQERLQRALVCLYSRSVFKGEALFPHHPQDFSGNCSVSPPPDKCIYFNNNNVWSDLVSCQLADSSNGRKSGPSSVSPICLPVFLFLFLELGLTIPDNAKLTLPDY